jgi:hypothetical protein
MFTWDHLTEKEGGKVEEQKRRGRKERKSAQAQ